MATTTTTQKEYVIPLENKPGSLAEVTSALGKANINILGYLLEAQGEFGIFRFITNDPTKTEGWLRQASRPFRTNEVIAVSAPSNPGELGRLTTTLSKSGVNITASYPTSVNNALGIAFAVDNLAGARKALGG